MNFQLWLKREVFGWIRTGQKALNTKIVMVSCILCMCGRILVRLVKNIVGFYGDRGILSTIILIPGRCSSFETQAVSALYLPVAF